MASQGRILVVDDELLNRTLLGYELQGQGHSVAYAENGVLALEALRDQPFDLVLLDLEMPEMDGFQVLSTMKGDRLLRYLPVIMISAVEEIEAVFGCIEMGAEDYLPKPFNPVLLRARIDASLERKRLHDMEAATLRQVRTENRRWNDLIQVVIPLGVALSAEKEFHQLLERVVLEAKALCNADGGTLYLHTDDERLEFMILRNDTLNMAQGGTTGQPIALPPLLLHDAATGEPNHRNVATHTALVGASVNIADARVAEGYDFSGTRAFDEMTGYRSISFLATPLKSRSGAVIGVLQLLNAQDPDTGQIIPFEESLEQMLESLAALASVALEGYVREQSLRAQIAALRIDVDVTDRARQVEEITETDFFQHLRTEAKKLRPRAERSEAGPENATD
jgi:DNA-binding response OmpR family regulator